MTLRGSVVLVALPGDYGKPRPALVVQADAASDLPSQVVRPITTTIRPDLVAFRPTVEPSATNGLRQTSQVMLDKPVALARDRVRDTVGILETEQMGSVSVALALLLDIA